MPASLEKKPRLTPFITAAAMLPATPPATSRKPNALETMSLTRSGKIA